MPEILEIEYYRVAAEASIGRPITDVITADLDYLVGVGADEVRSELIGESVVAARRQGKLLMLQLSTGRTLGMRFGMTGRLIVDGSAPIEKLEYASGQNKAEWERFGVAFEDGGRMVISDPRRLGNVTLDPDTSKMGPDAWTATVEDVQNALGASNAAVKSRLMDQARLAGLGNLLTDEVLWRAGLNPTRTAVTVDSDEIVLLQRTIAEVLDELYERGGSHTGDLQEERSADGRCPRDGAQLRRTKVGGRTTMWCPEHQR